jgi:hypothetical protein
MVISLLLLAVAAQTQPMPGFIAGCWDLIEGENWTQECWMEPRAGLMLGASREGSGTKLKSWEQMRIEHTSDGKLVLLASPEGHDATTFEARPVGENAIEFTNSKHDYPQRIRYELKGDKLEAEISLIDGSKPTRWTYVREKP